MKTNLDTDVTTDLSGSQPSSDLLIWKGSLLPEGVTDGWMVAHFAGIPVPEDGLRLLPLHGGELTVWPSGIYEFIVQESLAEETGSGICYAYGLEDEFGFSSQGSLELGIFGHAPQSMHDFQGWSLAGLLEGPLDMAQLSADAEYTPEDMMHMPDAADVLHVLPASVAHGGDFLALTGGMDIVHAHGDPGGDETLTKLLLDAQQS